MNTDFYAFGEILWDCLPSARHAGGAPFNVAAHLAQLGVSASLISAVGQDAMGDELLKIAAGKSVNTQFVARSTGLATGTVRVTVNANGDATYEIVQPVAWDEIDVPADALEAVAKSQALIVGSLAQRSPHNLAQLNSLLALKGPMKFFDVNLRPPFADPARIFDLARRADILKLNDDELGQLASWANTGQMTSNTPRTVEALAKACAILGQATGISRICVTRAADGAAMWDNGNLTSVPAPRVVVKDTVGAGDAFTAGLMVGLTRGVDTRKVLEQACRLGAYVASQDGAIPALPPAMAAESSSFLPSR